MDTQRRKVRKESKKLVLISTEAALLSSTFLAFIAIFSDPNSPDVREALASLATFQGAGSPQCMKPNSARVRAWNKSMRKIFASSLEVSSQMLAVSVTLEKIYRTLDPKDPRDIVAMLYCVLRVAKGDESFAEIKSVATNNVGKNWLWPVVWEIALTIETVKKRWDREAARDEAGLYLAGWKEECRDFANNYWTSCEKKLLKVQVLKKRMTSSFRKAFPCLS